MNACPACSAEVPEASLRCDVCRELLLSDEWRRFCERYDAQAREARRALVEGLAPEEQDEFRRVREVWRAAHPEERTTSIFNPIPRGEAVARPAPPSPVRSYLVALLPALLGLPVVLALAGSRLGLAGLLAASLLGAIATACGETCDLRRMTMLTGWLAVSLAAALTLYF